MFDAAAVATETELVRNMVAGGSLPAAIAFMLWLWLRNVPRDMVGLLRERLTQQAQVESRRNEILAEWSSRMERLATTMAEQATKHVEIEREQSGHLENLATEARYMNRATGPHPRAVPRQ